MHTCTKGASPNNFFQNNVIVTFRGEGGQPRDILSANKMLAQTTLFGTILHEKGGIYDHPTTQYEQFIKQYYGRGGKGCDVMGGGGGGGFQLNVTMTLFSKNYLETPPEKHTSIYIDIQRVHTLPQRAANARTHACALLPNITSPFGGYSTLAMHPYLCKHATRRSILTLSFQRNDEYAGACWRKKTRDGQSLALPDTAHRQEREQLYFNIKRGLLVSTQSSQRHKVKGERETEAVQTYTSLFAPFIVDCIF